MAARRKTTPKAKRTARRGGGARGLAARIAAVVVVAAGLFGGGVGLGAWIAGGSKSPTSPASHQSAQSGANSGANSGAQPGAHQAAPPVVAKPETARPVAPDVPLPRMAAVAPASTAGDSGQKAGMTRQPAVAPSEPIQRTTKPAWQAFAVAAAVPPGAPMIAIVLDDIGIDRRRSDRAIGLPGPITLAFLPYAESLDGQTAAATRNGHELLVHVPMQPHGADIDPGPNVLDMRLGAIEVLSRLDWNLERFGGFVGINNHMGSLFTESEEGMRLVAEGLRDRGLMFLDSLTSPKSVAASIAEGLGVPTTTRDVFLDNTDTAAEVELRLAQTERVARQTGAAIAIGHPRDATLNVLEAWIPQARARGFVLVPVTTVLKARMAGPVQQASRP